VKPDSDQRFRSVLAAVDVSAASDEEQRLNHEIIDIAGSVAKLEDAELHVATSAQLWMEAWLERADRFSSLDMSRIARERTERAERSLETIVANIALSTPVTSHVLHGEAEVTIPKTARDLKTDLLVIGTLGRSGLPGLIMGNTAEQILDRISCAVLALKPDGFVSPVAELTSVRAGLAPMAGLP